MKGSRCWWLMGCLGAALLGAPSVQAADGQITFSGAVVEPTCSLSDAGVIPAASQPTPAPGSPRFACGSTGAPTGKGGAFALTEVSLNPATIGDDRVLAYFANYLSAAGMAEAKLVTQTFE